MSIKLDKIIIPFFLVLLIFLPVYTLTDWWLFIRSEYWEVNENLITIWLPLMASIILVWLFVWPGLKLLVINVNVSSPGFFFRRYEYQNRSLGLLFIVAIILWVPTLLVQLYIRNPGKVSYAKSLSGITAENATPFYSVEKAHINKAGKEVLIKETDAGIFTPALLSVFAAAPFDSITVAGSQDQPLIWLCYSFEEKLSGKISSQDKNQVLKKLHQKADSALSRNTVHNLELIKPGWRYKAFAQAVAMKGGNAGPGLLFFSEKDWQPGDDSSVNLWEISGLLILGLAAFLFVVNNAQITSSDIEEFKATQSHIET